MYPGNLTGVITIENVGEPWNEKELVKVISAGILANENSTRAQEMSAYMRNQFTFLGVPAPMRRRVVKAALKEYSPPTENDFVALARSLHQHKEREFQLAAVDILVHYRKLVTPSFLNEPAQFFITQKSWWDSVDALNPLIRDLVQAQPICVSVMREWINSDNIWIARSSLTHQLTMKSKTDTQRLAELCSIRAGDREFFIAKAVGWALRDYSHTDPDWVREYVGSHPELSALARREAMKAISRESSHRRTAPKDQQT